MIRIMQRYRIGSKIERAVKPLARAIGHPCVDKTTGKLIDGSPCAKRRDRIDGVVDRKPEMK